MSSSPALVSLGQPVEADPGPGAQPVVPVNLPVDLPTMLRELEDAYIRAAKLLGMGRTTLVEKLRRRNLAARTA